MRRTIVAIALCLATAGVVLPGSARAQAAVFDDADAQLRLRQAAGAAAEAAAAADRLRKALAAERGKVVTSDAERDLNRETIASLEKSLRDAETRQRDTDKALKEAQEARARGLAGDAERRKLEAARPATPVPPAPPRPTPPPAAPRPQAVAPALPPLVPLPPNTAGWIADARTGCRVWTSAVEGATFSWNGPCPNGIANGHGVLQWYRNGQPINLRYEGERRDGKANGQGVQVTENGIRYQGEFREGLRSGRGSYTQPNGDRYDGEWFGNKFHGRGTFVWANGSRFEGEWRDNRPNGYGALKKADGNSYVGTWSNGCFKQGSREQAINASAKDCGFN